MAGEGRRLTDDLTLLRDSRDHRSPVTITVTECWYSCCARGWRRRRGQSFTGRIASLNDTDLLMVADGVGTMSFAVAARLDAVEQVALPGK